MIEKMYNCHTHIFTLKNVPNNFIAIPIQFLMNYSLTRPLARLLRNLNPFNSRDSFDRYAAFIEQGDQAQQVDIFKNLIRHYPSNAAFIVLSMDFEYMGAGNCQLGYLEQLQELAAIKAHPDYKDKIIPFVAIDPRRPNLLDIVKDHIENKGFGGLKMYPPLGFYPFDDRLDVVYEYAVQHNLPIMTHCNPAGISFKSPIPAEWLVHPKTQKPLPKTNNQQFSYNFSHPDNYQYVLEKFPTLKICLAHFGGAKQWKLYANSSDENVYRNTWLYKIKQLLLNPLYPNVFTDISYTISAADDATSSNMIDPELLDILNIFLVDPVINKKILFGSDFYMSDIEGSEFKFSIRLRKELGEEFFKLIAETNAIQYIKSDFYKL